MSDAAAAPPPGGASLILRAQAEADWAGILALAAERAYWGPRETQAVITAAVTLGDHQASRLAALRAIAADMPAPARAGCALALARGGQAEDGLAVLVADPAAPLHRASLPALMHLAGAPDLPAPLRSLARSLLRRAAARAAVVKTPLAATPAPTPPA